jgi:hypothetical protein
VKILLANSEPSTHGPSRHFAAPQARRPITPSVGATTELIGTGPECIGR